MPTVLTRLFSIRAGEEKKTVLLFSLHLLFYLGLMWGEFTSETLFLQAWGADSLALMFIGNALLAFALALVYTLFVDRFSNARLLQIIVLGMMAWLVSVRILLETDGGAFGAVYPYFYLGYGALRDLSTLHILNYINDFYDTRAAKSALPLMLSAGTVGSTLAGLSAPLLGSTVGLPNVTVLWAVCLILVLAVMLVIRRQLWTDIARIRQARLSAKTSQSILQNLRAGWSFVRESGALRWLAIATFAMVVLMRLLNFQSSQVFLSHYQDDPHGLFNFYGILGGLASAVGLVFQALLLSRLIARLGVGTTNVLFPSITFVSVAAMDFLPNMLTATFARLDLTMIKQAIRNPLDAMLYNAVPLHVKGRAKAFVNAMVVPLGTLAAGALLLGVQAGGLSFGIVVGVGMVVALIYLLASWRVRSEYGRALTELLSHAEMAILQLSQDEFAQPDPVALRFLHDQMSESSDDAMTLFIAEMLYELQGREAIRYLCDFATQRSTRVRAGIIQMLGADWTGEPVVRSLCLQGIVDPDAGVREAAALALVHAPATTANRDLLDLFLGLLNDPEESVQAAVVPSLIASGDPHFSTPAQRTLSTWLVAEADTLHRTLGLRVLARTGDPRLITTLASYLVDPSAPVRRQAAELIAQMASHTRSDAVRKSALQCFRTLLTDKSESVRLAAVDGLGHLNSVEASRALVDALADRSFSVRRRASTAIAAAIPPELEKVCASHYYRSECAAFILASANQPGARQRALGLIQSLVCDAYTLHLRRFSLADLAESGARLLHTCFQEEVDAVLERVFWLLGALSQDTQLQAIHRALASDDPLARANAIEALEAVTSPQLGRLITPLSDRALSTDLRQTAREVLKLPMPTAQQVFARVWGQFDGQSEGTPSPNLALFDKDDLLAAVSIYAQVGEIIPQLDSTTLRTALQATLEDERPLVRETAEWALARLDARPETGEAMLSSIGKVVFLKQVPFFQGMTVSQLRVLASISEEVTFEEGQQVIEQGTPGDALYIVVSGQVAIQRKGPRRGTVTRLTTLGPKAVFGETSFFDSEPRSADGVALEATQLLLVRQAPFLELVRQHPDLAVGLLKVFSQRLRQANAVIAEKTQAKPKALVDLYDKL